MLSSESYNFGCSHASGGRFSTPQHLWEKRVVLDCVAAVRSAEHEFGPHSFELQGVEDKDNQEYLPQEEVQVPKSPINTLVLRALDNDEMREWLFQFHRALASFVRTLMQSLDSINGLEMRKLRGRQR